MEKRPADATGLAVPAMVAGITDRLWSLEDVVAKIDTMTPAPKKRGRYNKRVA